MDIYQDFEEFVELLKKNKVEYLIIGGYATSIYSRPKYTKDLDIWINPTKSNSIKMLKTLESFGTGNLEITLDDLLNKDLVIQLGYPPVRIDMLKDIPGVKFKAAYKQKTKVSWGKAGNVNFISLEYLLINKEQSARKKDFDDIEWIKKYSKKKKNK